MLVVALALTGCLAATADEPKARELTPVQWRKSQGGNDHWYQAVCFAESATFDQARDFARGKGGDLVAISNTAESQFVWNLANDPLLWKRNSHRDLCGPWIGAQRARNATGWEWSSGEPWTFTSWAPGQPNFESQTRAHYWTHDAMPRNTWQDNGRTAGEVFSAIIEYTGEPASVGAPPTTEPELPPVVVTRPAKQLVGDEHVYLVVPIRGRIGANNTEGDVFAEGVRDALAFARRNKIGTIVFEIDTPGGNVVEAKDISDAIRESWSEFQFIAVVKRSLSAGLWITLACDRVYVRDASTIGAAVCYYGDATAGNAAVDAKFNSAVAAQLAAFAESVGKPADLFRAMVLPEMTIYEWLDPNSNVVKVGTSAPSGVTAKRIDSEASVLTLTTGEMIRYGLAELVDPNEFLKKPAWKEFNKYGAAAMQNAKATYWDDKAARARAAKRGVLARQRDWDEIAAIRTLLYEYEADAVLRQRGRATNKKECIEAWNRVRAKIQEAYTIMRNYSQDDFSPWLLEEFRALDLRAALAIDRIRDGV